MWLITHRQPIRAVKPKQLAVAFLPLDLSVSDPNTGLVVVRRRKEDAPNKEQLLSRLTSHDIPSWNFTAGCRHLTPVLVSLGWRAAFRRLPASLLIYYRSASHVSDLTPCLLCPGLLAHFGACVHACFRAPTASFSAVGNSSALIPAFSRTACTGPHRI